MSILDDEEVLTSKLNLVAEESIIRKFPLLYENAIPKSKLIGYDAFGREARKGDWVIFKPASGPGLQLGKIIRVNKKTFTLKVKERMYRKIIRQGNYGSVWSGPTYVYTNEKQDGTKVSIINKLVKVENVFCLGPDLSKYLKI